MLTLQFSINGILIGGVYALIAVSIVLVYKATQIFNFAVGELMTLGGFICYSLVVWGGFPLWLTILCGILLAIIIGGLVERLLLRPLFNQPILTIVMATLALASVLEGLVLMVWQGEDVAFPDGLLPGSTLYLDDIIISNELLWAFGIAMASFIVLAYFFRKTKTGLKMRGVSEDHELSSSCGIDITSIFAVTWIMATILGMMSGFLLGNRTALSISTTPIVALNAFPAVIFGGLESIPGAIIGGLTIGLIESLVGGLVDPTFGKICPYIILLIVLVIRPEGLFGLKRIERI